MSGETMGMSSTQAIAVVCEKLAKVAECEFAAYIRAVKELHGERHVMLSADDWLKRFSVAEIRVGSEEEGCRSVTIEAARHLAELMRETGIVLEWDDSTIIGRCSQGVA